MVDLDDLREWGMRGSFCGVRQQTATRILAAAQEIEKLRADLATYVAATEAEENRKIDAEFALASPLSS